MMNGCVKKLCYEYITENGYRLYTTKPIKIGERIIDKNEYSGVIINSNIKDSLIDYNSIVRNSNVVYSYIKNSKITNSNIDRSEIFNSNLYESNSIACKINNLNAIESLLTHSDINKGKIHRTFIDCNNMEFSKYNKNLIINRKNKTI